MISIKEALNIVLQNIPSIEFEEVDLKDAIGKRLAENVYAPFHSPRFSSSMMDGYAVKQEDYKNKFLEIIGESKAGFSFKGVVKNGEAVAISTGAKIPEGADAVIPLEEIERVENRIRIKNIQYKLCNIKFIGDEFKAGELLIKKETGLTSARIGLLASIGKLRVKVHKNPEISIIATGTELNRNFEELDDEKIFDSNSIMLVSAVKECGGNVTFSTVVEDDLNSTIEILERAEEVSDIVLFTGGVSVGMHDFVRCAAEKCGYKELFWGVKQKPGKPLFFAVKEQTRRTKLLFGLPGNPVSSYICFFHYAAQVIYKLHYSEPLNKKLYVLSSRLIINSTDRSQLFRVKLINEDNSLKFKLIDKQDSYMITSISEADGYIIVEEKQMIKKDSLAEIFLFPNRW